jgi:hypothetical protein
MGRVVRSSAEEILGVAEYLDWYSLTRVLEELTPSLLKDPVPLCEGTGSEAAEKAMPRLSAISAAFALWL